MKDFHVIFTQLHPITSKKSLYKNHKVDPKHLDIITSSRNTFTQHFSALPHTLLTNFKMLFFSKFIAVAVAATAVSALPAVPTLPKVPGAPSVPGLPTLPKVPGAPSVPGLPKLPPRDTKAVGSELPAVPAVPALEAVNEKQSAVSDPKVIIDVGASATQESCRANRAQGIVRDLITLLKIAGAKVEALDIINKDVERLTYAVAELEKAKIGPVKTVTAAAQIVVGIFSEVIHTDPP